MAATIAVVGGGPMGMAVAYQLALEGAKPVLVEADDRLGGMAASFPFAGQTLERYYHFHCLSDGAFFELLQELGLADQMRWRHTSMGFFLDGRLYPWGSAGSVLSFRRLPLLTRIRYLLHAARCLSLRSWSHLDGIRATDWLKTWLGPRGYALLWQKLFAYKFYQHSDKWCRHLWWSLFFSQSPLSQWASMCQLSAIKAICPTVFPLSFNPMSLSLWTHCKLFSRMHSPWLW